MARIDRRIGLLFAFFVVLLCAAIARASYLDVFQAGSLAAAAQVEQVQTVATPLPRGEITDRNGVVLALSESADEVIADPHLIAGDAVADHLTASQIAAKIAPMLSMSEPAVLARLTKRRSGYSPVAYDAPAAEATAVENLRINGLSFVPVQQRVYPRSTTAAQVLGWVGTSDDGLGGIEYRFNRDLTGRAGVRRIVYDAVQQPIAVDQLTPSVPGKNISLTIDAAIQDKVEEVLAGVGAEYSPVGATAIVMNPNTSQILALANWPFVNANDVGATPFADTADQAVQYQYEPGSTFKAITVAGALQDGLVNPNTVFTIPPDIKIGTYTIQDAEAHGYEPLTVAQILKVSSNLGADKIAATEGPQQFDYWVRRFGFGERTGITLPGEAPGDVPHWQQYTPTSMFTLPFGQGVSVTPIQMATAYSAIADGGVLRKPSIVKSIGGVAAKLPRGHRIISEQTASELRSMLRGVFADGGTASGAQIPGYDLAGKTGTAQVAVDGKYSATKFVASFIGMVPASAPKLLVAVVVFEPQGSIYGGSVAAPAFQKIVGWTVPYLGINPCPAPCPASAYASATASTP